MFQNLCKFGVVPILKKRMRVLYFLSSPIAQSIRGIITFMFVYYTCVCLSVCLCLWVCFPFFLILTLLRIPIVVKRSCVSFT
jgi:hypothetical protein